MPKRRVLVDSLIAASAIAYDCLLLHEDRHFALIAKHAPLHIHPHHAVARL